jgi:hypothetical protein
MKDLQTRSLAWRGIVAAVVGGASLIGSAVVAHADDVANNVDVTVDATAELMTLDAGGPSGATLLRILPTNGDGKSGCNLTGQTTLVAAVSSSSPDVATVSPSSVTFDACGATPQLTVIPLSAGSTTISLKEESNTSDGTFNLAPATFTVTVKATTPANTPPTVGVSGVTHGATYELGTVPAAGCSVTDAEDATPAAQPMLSPVTGPQSSIGLGSQTATCSYTDTGGLSASASATYSIVDTLAPKIAFDSRTPVANDHGWNNGDVTVTWTCDPAGGTGVVAGTATTTVSDEGENQSATGTCMDLAGNSASATVENINIDKNGPSITWNGGPAADGHYYFGSVPAAPTCSATDPLSGVDGVCSFDGYKDTVGTHTMTAVAKDLAGNTTTVQRKYNVLAWTLKGFYQPVDMGPVLNTVKGGSTVPFKFEVFAGSTELTDPSIASFAAKLVACPGTSLPSDDVEFTTTGATSLRYDSTAGQFIQNWQTPKKPGSCYVVTMTTDDGSALSANFKLK